MEPNDEAILLASGFEEAFLGLAWQFNTPFAVYDRSVCIRILMDRDGMSEDDADEFFEVNVQGSYVGKNTPAFLLRGSIEDLK